ncbi:MAG: serine/threonine-protein kinase [Sandaracinaceae bacterium]|nr:serine/threonine-protein kinase [Sandaracinaceae bacterium]
MKTRTDPGAGPRASETSSRESPSLSRAGRGGGFRIERFLGRGGMGEVFVARDPVLGRKVVIKLVHSDLVRDEIARRRFLREAQTTARFNHPNIVQIHAAGESGGVPYVALEHIDGESLEERLRQRLPSHREALRMMHAVAAALAEAHAHGVLHRDIKPSNVVVGRDGRLRVVDFGLAHPIASPEGDGPRAGTPAFMAPEQWRGEEVTAAVDVWACGVLLFQLLTGELPYEDLSLTRLRAAVCSEAPAPALPAGVGHELRALVASCLSKSPSARPTAIALRDALGAQLSGEATRRAEGPFRGLRAFGQEHAAGFFGRESEIERVLERLRDQPTVVIAGASGVGKTSFVSAGLLPRMREREKLLVLEVRPTDRPFAALATRILRGDTFATEGATPPPAERVRGLAKELEATPGRLGVELRRLADEFGGSVVLFVDQLEEAVTLVADPAQRDAYLGRSAARRTIRSTRFASSSRCATTSSVGSAGAWRTITSC